MRRISLALALSFFIHHVTAQTYPVTDRSLAYAAAYTVESQKFQLEAGYYNVWNLGKQEGNVLSGYSTRLRFGLFEDTELRGGISYNMYQFGNGGYNAFEDLEIGIKTKLVQESQYVPAFYFLGNLSFPDIDPPLQSSIVIKNSAEVRLIIEKYISDIFIIGGNVGWRSAGNRAGLNYVGALRVAVTDNISVYGEYFGRKINGIYFDFIDAAVEFWVLDGVVVDIAAGVGTTDVSDGGFISVGFAKLFE